MFENEEKKQICVLVCVDTGEYDAESSLLEMEELARTAEAEVAAKVIQKRPSIDKATCIGSGKLQEIKEICRLHEADLIIFDRELTATQIRNIEEATDVRVVDRTALILDIFAMRAKSKEGRIQVELAQQKYLLPRLSGIGSDLSRLGGGIGTRGPGETRLETDRRHIRRRIDALESQLAELEARRHMMRKRRKKNNLMSIALVGYTNVGKSTLLNALTNAGVLAENKLFATLDPTARALELPDGRTALLVDTVGLIRRLPHGLVEAFKSTLEEATEADLILHVCDASSNEAQEQAKVTLSLLEELGCSDIPVITVFNKCDKLIGGELPKENGKNVYISAKTGFGLDRLLSAISENLAATARRFTMLFPYDKAGLISKIREEGKIFSEEFGENGILVDALVDRRLFSEAAEFICKG